MLSRKTTVANAAGIILLAAALLIAAAGAVHMAGRWENLEVLADMRAKYRRLRPQERKAERLER